MAKIVKIQPDEHFYSLTVSEYQLQTVAFALRQYTEDQEILDRDSPLYLAYNDEKRQDLYDTLDKLGWLGVL